MESLSRNQHTALSKTVISQDNVFKGESLNNLIPENHDVSFQDFEMEAYNDTMGNYKEVRGEDGKYYIVQGGVQETEPQRKERERLEQELVSHAEQGNAQGVAQVLATLESKDLHSSINTRGLDQWTPLHFAVQEGRIEVIKELLKHKAINVNLYSSTQRTPLHLAAMKGSTDILRLLVSAGAYKNKKDADGGTALHYASEYGQLQCVIYLVIEANADPLAKNKYGYTPSDIAQNIEIRQFFQKYVNRETVQNFNEENQQQYARTAFNGVLRHNDRVAMVQRLMHSTVKVGKMMPQTGEEQKKHNQEDKKNAKARKWKEKLIQVWQYNDKMEMENVQKAEKTMGPKNFIPIMKLGQGSFGSVYLVEKILHLPDGSIRETQKQYAMKILSKKQVIKSNLIKYTTAERNILTYTSHPFIVGLKYAFQTPEYLFLLLDFAPGGNMSRALQKEKRFSEERAKMYTAEVLLSLEELHKRGIIYRDLKPDNIVFDAQGHALLTDFGLSKEGVQADTVAKSFCGSPAYLAPEMVKRSGHGQAIDWYQLGALLYEMLVGIPPYYANTREQLFSNILSGPLKLPKFLSDDSRSILLQLLNRNPLKRLGAGPRGAEEIKEHPFFSELNWEDVLEKKLPVPVPTCKKIVRENIALEKVYGRGAFDEKLKSVNRINEWTFIQKT